jgi:hypothetical protein
VESSETDFGHALTRHILRPTACAAPQAPCTYHNAGTTGPKVRLNGYVRVCMYICTYVCIYLSVLSSQEAQWLEMVATLQSANKLSGYDFLVHRTRYVCELVSTTNEVRQVSRTQRSAQASINELTETKTAAGRFDSTSQSLHQPH